MKLVTLLTMPLAVPSTPRTTLAAKAAPGKVGRDGVEEDGPDGRAPMLGAARPAPAVAVAHGR